MVSEDGFDEVFGEEAELHERTRRVRGRVGLGETTEIGQLAEVRAKELEVTGLHEWND